MVRHYTDELLPAVMQRRLVRQTCDLCGRVWLGNWDNHRYSVAHTIIECRIGADIMGGSAGKFWQIDLCHTCFVEKLVPWLQSQGAEIEPTDWEW